MTAKILIQNVTDGSDETLFEVTPYSASGKTRHVPPKMVIPPKHEGAFLVDEDIHFLVKPMSPPK